jgi:hypothetical protein
MRIRHLEESLQKSQEQYLIISQRIITIENEKNSIMEQYNQYVCILLVYIRYMCIYHNNIY